MATPRYIVELMDSSFVWQDRTADCKLISISQVGMVGPRYGWPQVGRCALTMNNQSKNYNPSQAVGIGTGYVDLRRRARVRYSNDANGYFLKTTTAGIAESSGGAVTPAVGNGTHPTAGLNGWLAQPITATATGTCYAIKFGQLSLTGSVGTAYLEVWSDSAGNPGTMLSSQIIGATPSGLVAYIPPFSITSGTVYHVLVRTTTTTLGLRTNECNAGYTYNWKLSINQGASWSAQTHPLIFELLIGGADLYQQVSSSSTAGDNYVLQWDAWTEFDSQYNTDYVRIQTSAEACAIYTPTYTNKRKTYSLTFTTIQNATTVKALFSQIASAASVNGAAIYYDNISLKKNGGSNLLVNGDFSNGTTSSWLTRVDSPASITLSTLADGAIIFQGFIDNIQPAFGSYGPLDSTINCVDWVEILKTQNIKPTLQENKTANQLITYVLGYLTPATFNATIPGTLLDSGKTVIDKAFDGATQNANSMLELMIDAALSEHGRIYVDRDGTLRFINRDWLPYAIIAAPDLALSVGQAWKMSAGEPRSDINFIINSAVLTYHPRLTGGSVQVLATATSGGPLTVPGKNSDGTPGTLTVSLTYHDATGRVIGGKNIQPIVAGTDYTANEVSSGTGIDYTNSPRLTFSVAADGYGASQTTVTFSNMATGTLYLTLLQVRGNPVTQYDPVQLKFTDPTSISNYQERTYTKDLAYASDQQFATSLGQFLVGQYKYPIYQVGGVKIEQKTKLSISVPTELLNLELYKVVSVTDAQTGIAAMKHVIIGFNCEIEPNATDQIKSIEFMLERIDMHTFFILDDPVYGVLDVATNLLYI